MRIRTLAVLVIASLAVSPLFPADQKLSSAFLKPAGDYLQFVRDCSARVLVDIQADCNFGDNSGKANSAAATPGDKLVVGNLDTWGGEIVLYSLLAFETNGDPQKQAQRQNGIKHIADVCSAEIAKALQDQAAPEKSPCRDALNSM